MASTSLTLCNYACYLALRLVRKLRMMQAQNVCLEKRSPETTTTTTTTMTMTMTMTTTMTKTKTTMTTTKTTTTTTKRKRRRRRMMSRVLQDNVEDMYSILMKYSTMLSCPKEI